MNKLLKKIANILFINVQNVSTIDLLNGKIQIVFFFYHYFRYSKIETYNEFADYLLDEMIEKLEQMDVSILITFGWTIEYLIQNKFVEGDPNEVMEDINEKIMIHIKQSKDMHSETFLFLGAYLLFRIKRNETAEQREECRFLLSKINEIVGDENNYQLAHLNFALFSLLEMHNIGMFNFDEDENQIVLMKLIAAILHEILNNNYDQNDLETLLNFMDQYSFFKEENLKQIILEKFDFSEKVDILQRTWQNLLYDFDDFKQEKLDWDVVNSLLEKILFNNNADNLPVNKSLAELGLSLIFQSFK
jgi:hypothetical protein